MKTWLRKQTALSNASSELMLPLSNKTKESLMVISIFDRMNLPTSHG